HSTAGTSRQRGSDATRGRQTLLAEMTLLGHWRSRPRLVEREDVGLVPVTGLATVESFVVEHGAVEAIRRLAGFDLVSEFGDAIQDSGGLIHVITHGFEARGAAQDQEGVHAGL